VWHFFKHTHTKPDVIMLSSIKFLFFIFFICGFDVAKFIKGVLRVEGRKDLPKRGE